ncbi:Brp/Blh family beta-carotene 15,15'-dioxygenase [Halegenticoccus tardaugens]|uniref:Brp/Blh family beta-carotene 15,15'-dioxygenase n=1 Tax=Halegenticoccus tardaugens TaxID=2071624 RepID=UPI00100AC2D1|nr:Brp/Blh family beta-carotene 15,15'-dioxygenase [Halegenticoccus tardaugens]
MAVAALAPAATDRSAVVRLAYYPVWGSVAVLVAAFAVGADLPIAYQYAPLVASALLFGLPHGAADHLALWRARGTRPTPRRIALVGVSYLVLGGAYAAAWFVAPTAAFASFVLLAWVHWGQGDLYSLLAFVGADHLRTRTQRGLTVLVRGGLPMLVPLLAFPAQYRFVASSLVGLFDPAAAVHLGWLFAPATRLALGAAFAAVTAVSVAVGYRRRDADGRAGWTVDAVETGLLWAYFLVVPPILAVGWYFCVWHSLRHVVRLVSLTPPAADSDADGAAESAVPSAARRFVREATPLTAVSLALLVALAWAVPRPPGGDLAGLVALYLVLVAALTLPHVAIVNLMDAAEGVWDAPGTDG